MTQPTQEDLERVAIELLGLKFKVSDGIKWVLHPMTLSCIPLINFDPYTDDSLTGALVKAVFPLLDERRWCIVCKDNEVHIVEDLLDVFGDVILRAPNLNTALIEAYFKIKGEKR